MTATPPTPHHQYLILQACKTLILLLAFFILSCSDSTSSSASSGPLEILNTINDTDDIALARARDVTIATVNGTPYLFVAGGGDDGVSVFAIQDNGSLSHVPPTTFDTAATDTPNLALRLPVSVTTAVIANTTYLFVAANIDSGVSMFAVQDNGILTPTASIFDKDNNDFNLDNIQSITTAQVANTHYLFAAGYFDNGVSVFAITPQQNTKLNNQFNIDYSLDNTSPLFSIRTIATTQIGGNSYLFVGGDTALGSYQIADDGQLTLIGNPIVAANENFLINNIREIITTNINGTIYLFATGSSTEENGVSMVEVDANGTLTPLANNSLADDTNSPRIRGLASITLQQTPYLLAANALGKGLVLFEVQPEEPEEQEKLKEVASLPLVNDGLNNLATITLGGVTYVYMTAYQNDDSISVFRINEDKIPNE